MSSESVDGSDGWQSRARSLNERYEHMFKNQLFVDVCFIVGEGRERLHANKVILSTASPVFAAMFSERWSTSENSEPEVPDIEPNVFSELLRFIYCEKADFTKENVWAILQAADKYAIDLLKQRCVDFIKHSITRNNACFFLMKARSFNDESKLVQDCLEVIENDTFLATFSPLEHSFHDAPLPVGECFLNIDWETLCFILQRDTLLIAEIDLFMAMLRWGKVECKRQGLAPIAENQRTVLKEAIHLIRYTLMSHEDFATVVCMSDILSEKEELSVFLRAFKRGGPPTRFNEQHRIYQHKDKASSRVKIFTNNIIENWKDLEVTASYTIDQVKAIVDVRYGVPCANQYISYDSSEISDGRVRLTSLERKDRLDGMAIKPWSAAELREIGFPRIRDVHPVHLAENYVDRNYLRSEAAFAQAVENRDHFIQTRAASINRSCMSEGNKPYFPRPTISLVRVSVPTRNLR